MTSVATLVRGAISVRLDPDRGVVIMTCTDHGSSRAVQVSRNGYSVTVADFLDAHEPCTHNAHGLVEVDNLAAWAG